MYDDIITKLSYIEETLRRDADQVGRMRRQIENSTPTGECLGFPNVVKMATVLEMKVEEIVALSRDVSLAALDVRSSL